MTPNEIEVLQRACQAARIIEAKSPQLAVYFGLDAGVAHRRAEEAEAAKLRAESLKLKTEQLRQRNQAARQEREARAMQPSWVRGYRAF